MKWFMFIVPIVFLAINLALPQKVRRNRIYIFGVGIASLVYAMKGSHLLFHSSSWHRFVGGFSAVIGTMLFLACLNAVLLKKR